MLFVCFYVKYFLNRFVKVRVLWSKLILRERYIYIYIMNHFSLKLSKSTLVNRETLNIHAVKIMQSVKKNE